MNEKLQAALQSIDLTHIIIAAAGGESLPPAWPQQLAPGGRLVAPMVAERGQQMLLVLDKNTDGSCTQTILEAVHFVPLKSGIA